MKIENSKTYKVKKYTQKTTADCGTLPGEDVKRMLKGYNFDEMLEMWFTPKATIGYSVEEA